MITKNRGRTALAATTFVLAAWASQAQEPARNPDAPATTTTTTTTTTPSNPSQTEGPGTRVGGTIDRASKAIKEGVRETAESVRDRYNRAKTGVHAMNVQARVYGRLHWDKALGDAELDVEVSREGVATLKGAVADARAKARAADLARETVGVSSVVDQLAVRPTSAGARVVDPPVSPPTP